MWQLNRIIRSQRKKDKYHMHGICGKIYMYMWDLKYDTNELTYKTETDSQRWKANMITKGEKVQRRDKLGV